MLRFSCRRAAPFIALFASGLSLSACATQPFGPTIAVMPKPGESFADFQQHDMTCRAFAANASGADSCANANRASNPLPIALLTISRRVTPKFIGISIRRD